MAAVRRAPPQRKRRPMRPRARRVKPTRPPPWPRPRARRWTNRPPAPRASSSHGYARSGLLVNGNGNGGRGGPYITRPARWAGPWSAWQRDDTYMEANLLKTQTFDDGSWARYKLMLADGWETSNDWTASDSSLNTRQVFAGSAIWRASAAPSSTRCSGRASASIRTTSTSTGSTRTWSSSPGTGGGVYDVQLADSWKANFSLYGRDYGDISASGLSDIESYIPHHEQPRRQLAVDAERFVCQGQ